MLQCWRFRADHHARQRCIGFLRRVAHARHHAAAQHRAGGAQRTDFMQLVADVENRAAFAGQTAQHHEQLFDGLWREHRGRLVQNQHARLGEQRADDFHPLHLAHRQGVHRAMRIDLQPVVAGSGLHALDHLGQRNAFVETQPDVFRHGQRIEQAEMLKHHGDAEVPRLLRVADLHRLAIDDDAALVGLDRAVDDLHERGLARPVFAQNGVDFSWKHLQRHPIVRHHGGVSLGYTRQLQPGHWRR
ncbi:hypothetical protein SDC9_162603 [bioreactor metagenome]|uniref:Uncharacterized protein n=1 Tax=bioreactor metagenome TaxID=1076179 RepID=A0A645FT61_9ZZZZ